MGKKAKPPRLDPDATNQTALRGMCKHLPLPVVPAYKVSNTGPKKYISNDVIRSLIRRQLKEQEVALDIQLRQTARTEFRFLAHGFWANATKGPGAELAAKGTLTPINAVGLASLLEVGATVYLWTYHTEFTNLPEHPQLFLKDARTVLAEQEFLKLRICSWTWGNIADIVRLRAAFEANREGDPCWIVDVDTCWLAAPCLVSCPSVSGHRFATCAAQRRISGDAAYWKHQYLLRPTERSYMLPPLFFPPRSCILKSVQAKLVVQSKPPKQYTHYLECIKDEVIALGYSGDFQEVYTFHALHNWLPLGDMTRPEKGCRPAMHNYEILSAIQVLCKAVGFNNPWQTSMRKEDGERTALLSFQDGSFFQQVFSHMKLPDDVLRQSLDADSFKVLCEHGQGQDPQGKEKRRKTETAVVEGGYAGILEAIITVRNCSAFSVLWDHLPEDSKQLVVSEFERRGLRSPYLVWHADARNVAGGAGVITQDLQERLCRIVQGTPHISPIQ